MINDAATTHPREDANGLTRLEDWHRARKLFNHQKLKNEFSLALESLLRKSTQFTPAVQKRSIEEAQLEWQWLRAEALSLFDKYERDCTPVHYFSNPPVFPMKPANHEWLPTLLHNDWLSRKGVKAWVSTGGLIVTRVDQALDACLGEKEPCLSVKIKEVVGRCNELSEHLHNHPSRFC